MSGPEYSEIIHSPPRGFFNLTSLILSSQQKKAKYIIELSAPAETNIVRKEEDKGTKYKDLLFGLRRLKQDHYVRLMVVIIGSLDGMRQSLISELRRITNKFHKKMRTTIDSISETQTY